VSAVRDEIVTTFCERVTSCSEAKTRRRAGLATKELGEAMASALETPPPGGTSSGAGVTPVFVALAAALALAFVCACGDDSTPPAPPPAASITAKSAADPATGQVTDLDGTAPAFGDAVIAELTGDPDAARAAFERVLAAPDTAPALAARAALHLAQLDARAGKSRHALDLVARASALAPTDPEVIDGASQVEADLVAASGAGEIRGPALDTPLPGVEPRVAAMFATAEHALARVHQMRPRAVIEALSSSLREKEDATEDVVAKYRAVADHGGLAQVAADYRTGSLYHDLALGLLFELPPELDPAFAAGLRRTLRVRAIAYLRRAVVAYRACLATQSTPDAELWQLAAETDLRSASDVLASAP
jgi:hypothetical protein